MGVTNLQKTIVTNKLSTDLTVLTNNRLVELCLLYRASPDALLNFPNLLEVEVHRRFTVEELATSGTIYSVLQNFCNTFKTEAFKFKAKMSELNNSSPTNIWFIDNLTYFKTAINDLDNMNWLVTKTDIITKILYNSYGLEAIGKSTNASTVVLTTPNSEAIWKGVPNLWSIWIDCAEGVNVILKSSNLINYVTADTSILTIIFNSSTVILNNFLNSALFIQNIASSTFFVNYVVTKVAFRNKLFANIPVLTNILNYTLPVNTFLNPTNNIVIPMLESSTICAVIVKSSKALAYIISNAALKLIITQQDSSLQFINFQSQKIEIYKTVKANWTRTVKLFAYSASSSDEQLPTLSSATNINAPSLVFVNVGSYSDLAHWSRGVLRSYIYHNGTNLYGTIITTATIYRPSEFTESNISLIAFNGAYFQSLANAWVHIEEWKPL